MCCPQGEVSTAANAGDMGRSQVSSLEDLGHLPQGCLFSREEEASLGFAEALWPRATNLLLVARPQPGSHSEPLLQGCSLSNQMGSMGAEETQPASRIPQRPSYIQTDCLQICDVFSSGSISSLTIWTLVNRVIVESLLLDSRLKQTLSYQEFRV